MKHRKKLIKKIAYVTGTRADFGLMTPILHAIKQSPKLTLQVYATGIHCMAEFGNTVAEVKKEFPNCVTIPVAFDTGVRRSLAEFAGVFIKKLVREFKNKRPDFVLVLGDRVEMLCAAFVCLYLGIPVGHVHGGDKTETVDDSARHAITKMSAVHFTATRQAAERVIQMGEAAERVHVVGAPALDVILHQKLPTRKELFADLQLGKAKQVILVTQYPVTEFTKNIEQAGPNMAETIAAVKSFHLPVVVVYPNADDGGRQIIDVMNREKTNPLFHIFPSLPYKQFLALEREAAVWVGNSSGAMIESASFQTPVVQVGSRQAGRLHGNNVITVGYKRKEIIAAIKKSLYSHTYRQQLAKVKNPWGDGRAARRVVSILEKLKIDDALLRKQITDSFPI